MVRILLNSILEGIASEFTQLSTKWSVGTRFFEKDTNTWYILKPGDTGNIWQNESPASLSSSTISTKFIPFTDQTGLIFGNGYWTGVFSSLLSDGSMTYATKTITGATNSPAYVGVDDYALAQMLPKVEIKCVIDDDTTSTAMFIGFVDNAVTTTIGTPNTSSLMSSYSTFIVSNLMHVGFGSRTTDTDWQIVNNDSTGTPNFQTTGISRDTDVHTFTIQYTTPTSVTLTMTNINGTVLASITKTTQIPPPTGKLQFHMEIRNADTSRRYGIWIYDHIYMEKRIPVATGVLT
jgi:hypothetical protein